jgi:cytochrome c553
MAMCTAMVACSIKFNRTIALSIVLLTTLACKPSNNAPQNAPLDGVVTAAKPAKLGLCAGCHGETGKAILPQYPNIGGQNALYLEKSLKAYRSGERKSAEMRPMVGTLTDAEITEFANYFAQQKPL